MMSLQKYTSPVILPKPTLRDTLDELVRSGYRPYICRDKGSGVSIAWARSVYTEDKDPDIGASIARVSGALQCGFVKLSKIEPSLEHLLSSSVRLMVDDFGVCVIKPVVF